ncbi:MAG: iron-sulfur cluster-binding domain-containing protein [Bacilli bacterium]|nr:iron-sulfur cluster-binding domain-containing protein [Bacilli bacterium]
MEKIKISTLGAFDEQKFKNLASNRDGWLKKGNDMVINPQTKTQSLVDELKPKMIIATVKKVLNETERAKTLVLSDSSNKSLPPFKPGQKIAVIINIDGNFYTRNFTLSGSVNVDSEYRITVLENKDDFVIDYLFTRLRVGEKFSITAPYGDFYYDSIRDEENILMIVNGSGVAAAYAMAQAVKEGFYKINLTIFYTEKKNDDLIYKNELIKLASGDNIRVGFVLSEESREDTLDGFVTLKLIQSELKNNTSIFISGTEGLLKYLEKELQPLGLPKKYIRYDSYLPNCNIKRVAKYNLSIFIGDEKYVIPCYNNKTILQAIEDGGIYIPSRCHDGSCGLCRSELVKGEVKIVNDKRVNADKKYNFIHPCSTYPLSDIEIVVR